MKEQDRRCGNCEFLETHGFAPRPHRVYACAFPVECMTLPKSVRACMLLPHLREFMSPSDGKDCRCHMPRTKELKPAEFRGRVSV